MLFVWLPASGQRADMGFFNRIRLYTDINVMCKDPMIQLGGFTMMALIEVLMVSLPC